MKNKTKKWFILLLVLGFIFTMSACSSGENDTSTNESAPATGETENTDTPENSAVAVEDSGILGVYDQKPVPSLKGKTIGVSVIGTNKHLNSMFYKGTLDKIEELGGTAIGVDAEQNDQKRLSDLDNLLVQKPDAIIGILGDAQVCAPSYKKISEAGIPIVTILMDTPYCVSNIDINNYEVGRDLAQSLFDKVGGEGKVAVFNGFYGVTVCGIRADMLYLVQKWQYPNIEFIEPELQDVMQGTVEDARKKTQDLLTKYPPGSGLKVIYSTWDLASVGISQAIEESGRKDIFTAGVDGEPVALDQVENSDSFLFTIANEPYKMGQKAAENVAKHLAGQDVPKTDYCPTLKVDDSNVAEARKILFPDGAN